MSNVLGDTHALIFVVALGVAVVLGACTARYVLDGNYQIEGETDGEEIQNVAKKVAKKVLEDCEQNAQVQPDRGCDEGRTPSLDNALLPPDRVLED